MTVKTNRTTAASALLGSVAATIMLVGATSAYSLDPVYDAPITKRQVMAAQLARTSAIRPITQGEIDNIESTYGPGEIVSGPTDQHLVNQPVVGHSAGGHSVVSQSAVSQSAVSQPVVAHPQHQTGYGHQAFHPIAPTLPTLPAQGQTPCEYYGTGNTCGAPAPTISPEISFIRSEQYAVQPAPQAVYQPQIVQQPAVVQTVTAPVYTKPAVIVTKTKKKRAFSDFWSYVGLGATYRTVTIPSKHGDAAKFNFYAADVRGGVMYKKYFGVEARLGLSGGGKEQDYTCNNYGYKCSLSLSAPLTAGLYARASYPIGKFLPYAVVGAAYKSYESTLKDAYYSNDEKFSRWDLSYGAGVEFAVTNELMIGAEYTNYGHDDHGFGVNARYVF